MRRRMGHSLLQTALYWAQSALSVSARAAHWRVAASIPPRRARLPEFFLPLERAVAVKDGRILRPPGGLVLDGREHDGRLVCVRINVSVVAATGLTGSLRGEFDDFVDVDWLPIPRQQRVELMSLGSPGHDALQHVGEPSHRIDAVHLRGLDQGHRDRPMTRSAVAARKERILSLM